VSRTSDTINIGFDDDFTDNLTDTLDAIQDGLACGFGGGACMSFPMNWAPLAPGSDPTLLGTPIGDGLLV